jgi:predicted  nucleic acid-binding Zn-ribbon protein
LHRWIDLINERGEGMYKAFGELRAHLEDIQRQIAHLHKANHEDKELMERLKRELEEWKTKCRKTKVDLEDVRARYEAMEKEHKKMMAEFRQCETVGMACSKEASGMKRRMDSLSSENRELQGRLLDAERYREMVARSNAKIRDITAEIARLESEIAKARIDLGRCRVDLVNAKNYNAPGYKRDTHVNLDMKMFITHNQTKEKGAPQYMIQYNEDKPKAYKSPEYKPAPSQRPQVYTQKTTYKTTTPYTTTTTTTKTTTTYTTTTTTTTTTKYHVPKPVYKPSYSPPQYQPHYGAPPPPPTIKY